MSTKAYRTKTVRILNPKAGCGWTSRRRADQYVRRGLARYENGLLIFLAVTDDHREQSTLRAIDGRSRHGNRITHRVRLETIRLLQPIQDSGLNAVGLQWPLPFEQAPGRPVWLSELA